VDPIFEKIYHPRTATIPTSSPSASPAVKKQIILEKDTQGEDEILDNDGGDGVEETVMEEYIRLLQQFGKWNSVMNNLCFFSAF